MAGVTVFRLPVLSNSSVVEHDEEGISTPLDIVGKDPVTCFRELLEQDLRLCDVLFKDSHVLQKLKEANYSLLLFDWENLGASAILAQFLAIPSISLSYQGFTEYWLITHQPSFYAYTPHYLSRFSDHMGFWERLENVRMMISDNLLYDEFISRAEVLKLRHFPNSSWPHLRYTHERVSMHLIAHAHFAFDYPRPIMPHVQTIPGLLWTPPKPLSKPLEDIMTSATNGVIIVSFGTGFPTLPKAKAEIFAKVFAKLSQTVIWRYVGPPPRSLGNNTHLVKWIPQNDALAHPATKLFITHCGVSSTWETLYHAVPVVAMPLLWDQYQNARKLTDRAKVGETVSFLTLTETDLENAIEKVLKDRSYKENAQKMSVLLQDTPWTGYEELSYWINYVIRHNGTLFLHSQPQYKLTWYQYFLIDIIVFVTGLCCLVIVGTYICLVGVCVRATTSTLTSYIYRMCMLLGLHVYM
ncbi:UDP-glucuronosyltransferase 1-9 [Lingula anatina]|uniref:UDP-glucuronosyltransferase n=1 Tax=Lingula anatina TaxID=7574 RepID=A0A1S3ICI6_LINAN|nr:UDP-glucuronosyltransferase 1-9 [Lingula anatina]|eukprot:XP_013395883.2 UDP-glucuronosyltransferase 1-9 [Lingula anatina]